MRSSGSSSGARSRAGCSAALLALAACGAEAPPPGAETGAYQVWRTRLTEVPSAGFAETVRGDLQILPPPVERVKRPDDFCELWLNGRRLHRLRLAAAPDGALPAFDFKIELRAGPNWLDFWDSTSNRGRRDSIDTREGTELLFSPAELGYDFTQTKKE